MVNTLVSEPVTVRMASSTSVAPIDEVPPSVQSEAGLNVEGVEIVEIVVGCADSLKHQRIGGVAERAADGVAGQR